MCCWPRSSASRRSRSPSGPRHKADIGISDADLSRVKTRTEAGQCLLGLRFSNDPFCFEQRFDTLRRELGDKFIAVEIDSRPGNPYGHPKTRTPSSPITWSTSRERPHAPPWTRR